MSKEEVLDDVYEKRLCACVRGTKKKQNREKKIECEGKKHCQEMSADYLKNGPI